MKQIRSGTQQFREFGRRPVAQIISETAPAGRSLAYAHPHHVTPRVYVGWWPTLAGVATVIGFDLDMTLVDSREAIIGALAQMCANRGIEHSEEELGSRIGLPLLDIVAALAPGFDPELAAAEYRDHYGRVGLDTHTLLPGAIAAVDRIRSAGGAVVVVTGKREDQARMVLETVGLDVEHVVGSVFGSGKGPSLVRLGADAYVGDHPGDIAGAREARVISVGVATGAHDAETLLQHGADIVLNDLRDFPGWLAYGLDVPPPASDPTPSSTGNRPLR